jgi:hypothetical protein
MGTHPRLDAAAIQTGGITGWDGFVVAVVSKPVAVAMSRQMDSVSPANARSRCYPC